jgi:sRNA-binding regulator protein Hfq
MKLQIYYIFSLMVLGCGLYTATNAQSFGMEQNSNGSYTIWMGGGSITTNTQGQYSVSNNQGTYCTGCYATPVYGYTNVYYAPNPGGQPFQQIVSAPPTGYSSYTIANNTVTYYNAQGGYMGTVAFGATIGNGFGMIGYAEGCTTCAQLTAQQQASTQWNTTFVSNFQAQTISYQQQTLASLQAQMSASYNQGNTYNYYYYFYAVQQVSGGVGATPLPPPPAALPLALPLNATPPANTSVIKLSADCGGNSIYVAPNGTAFILPAGAQVGALNIDKDDFSNGALYSFYIGGIQYAASETFYTRNNGAPLQFRGYYQVVDGRCDLTKPYPFNASSYPANPNGSIEVVRLKVEQSASGCQLVQEKVTYITYSGIPSTIPNTGNAWQDENTEIESATPVSTVPCSSTPIKCPGAGAGDTNSGAELEAYVKGGHTSGGISRVQGFLNSRTKNTVKIYLYDCSTNKVKHTLTKEALNELTTAEQDAEMLKFNSGNFTAADQDIAIKGCLQNGKWQYEVKYNSTKLAPHPKVADPTVLAAVNDEIKKQADDAVKKLKSAHARSAGESITVTGGEVFSKTSMDLFETLSAIYDVGKDIINDGKMPDKIWDGGKRANNVTDGTIATAHGKSPFQMPTIISGCTDQLIDEATGTVQLVKTTFEFVKHPIKTAQTTWNGVKALDWGKVKQIAKDASGITNFNKGGDPAKYQGGKTGVQVALIAFAVVKNVANTGIKVVNDGGENLTKFQTFMPDGANSSSVGDALQNAMVNNKLVDNINNEKLLTKNVSGTDNFVVGVEKQSNNSIVYKVKESELVDHRTGTPYTYDDLLDGAKDVDKPKTNITVNGIEEITTDAGQKGGWNKELNKPEPNKVYNVQNTNTGKPHKYTTGVGGRVEKVEAELKLAPRDRNGYQQSVKCNGSKGGTLGSDQGGHLIGSRFDGAGEQINLVPMTSDVNLSQWKTMENNWAAQLNPVPPGVPKTVKIQIDVKYDDPLKPNRPTRFIVTETIGTAAPVQSIFIN